MTLASISGLVSTEHPAASAAASRVLQEGGNAVDALIAAATALWAVQPCMSGPGGESFAIVRKAGEAPVAFIGAGAAPAKLDAASYIKAGAIPTSGPVAASVPGEVDVLGKLFDRYASGAFGWADLFKPSIGMMRRGVALTKTVAGYFAEEEARLHEFPKTKETYWPFGRAPRLGDVVVQKDFAASVETIANEGPRALYEGNLAKRIVAAAEQGGSALSLEDLAGFEAVVGAPISISWRGMEVHSTALPTQGPVFLETLGISGDADTDCMSGNGVHRLVESFKCAVEDRLANLGDPAFVDDKSAALLSEAHFAKRRADIADTATPIAGSLFSQKPGDTTYLCIADAEGTFVSYITSISNAFGCGWIAGDTGILLNDRVARGFSLDPASPNVLEAGKRTMHTLMPVLMTDGDWTCAIGTPGGDRQPQWGLQGLHRLAAEDRSAPDLSAVCAMPRWQVKPGMGDAERGAPTVLHMEGGFPDETVDALKARGHDVVVGASGGGGGALQAVCGDAGLQFAAADPRVDGTVLAG